MYKYMAIDGAGIVRYTKAEAYSAASIHSHLILIDAWPSQHGFPLLHHIVTHVHAFPFTAFAYVPCAERIADMMA